jgi:hypothetical protein
MNYAKQNEEMHRLRDSDDDKTWIQKIIASKVFKQTHVDTNALTISDNKIRIVG